VFPAGLFVVLTLILLGVGLLVTGVGMLFGAGWAVLIAGACALALAALASRGLNA